MAKTIDKRVNVWLNGQGIENNLKSVRAAILKTTNELANYAVGQYEIKKSYFFHNNIHN